MKRRQIKCSAIPGYILQYTLLIFIGSCSELYADETSDSIVYEITPYLWAASINGTTASNGEESPPIDTDYSFFSFDNLDGVFSTTFTARKNQWGFYFDYLYVAFEDTFKESALLETTTRVEGRIIELAGEYAPASIDNLALIAGLRRQDITVSLALLNRKPEQTATWTDPFIGAIYKRPLNDKFHIALRGDVGGFGIESDMAVNAQALIRYQISNTFSVKFAYRYLKVKFDDRDFLYDISLDGFQIGLGIRF